MVAFVDFAAKFDASASQIAVNQLIRMFAGAKGSIQREIADAIKSGMDTSAIRAGVGELRRSYTDFAAAEQRMARQMMNDLAAVEVAQRNLNRITKDGADIAAAASQKGQAAALILEQRTAAAAKSQRDHVDAMYASEAAAAKMSSGTKKAAEETSKMSTVMNVAGTVGVVGLGLAFERTTKSAAGFEQSQIRLQAGADETAANMKTVTDGILGMAGKVGYSAQELSNAMFGVEKAGFRGADGLKVLGAAAQLSKIENKPLEEVINGLTTSLHDFGKSGDQAAAYASKLRVAVGESKTPMDQFTGSLHSVEPIAAAVGMKLEDVWAALAQVTQSGTSAEQATDNMAHSITQLSKASGSVQMREMMGQMGIDAVDVSNKLGERGLAGTVNMLDKAIREHMDPAGRVIIDTFYKSQETAKAANDMFEKLPEPVKAAAQAIKDGTMSYADFRKTRGGLAADQVSELNQWFGLQQKIEGYSNSLKSGEGTVNSYLEVLGRMVGGQDAAKTAVQLVGKGYDEFLDKQQKITDAQTEAGNAVNGTAQTMRTLSGKLSEAQGAFSAMKIEVGTAFIPVMKDVADIARVVGEVMAKHPSIVEAVTVAVTGLTAAWAAFKAKNIATSILRPIAEMLGTVTVAEDGATAGAGRLGTALGNVGRGLGLLGAASVVGGFAQDATQGNDTLNGLAVVGTDAAQGAFLGGTLGSIIPGVGTAIGATVGGLAGAGIGTYNQLTGHAHGGPVYGRGPNGIDSVLTYLAPGEHVLTHHDVAAMGGHSNVHAFRNALHRATGGEIPGGGLDTHGAQVDTIAVAQAVQKLFGISNIGMYRSPDGFNEHSSGEAADVMVGNNAALGNQVASWVLNNASQFGVKYVLWRQRQWNPDGSSSMMQDRGGPTQNHMDHVHVRTAGGGFPAGGGPGANGVGSFPGGTSSVPAPAARGGFSLAGMMGGGGMGMGGASFSLGNMPAGSIAGFGSAGQPGYYSPAPAGAQVVNGPEGQPGYYTPVPERVDEKQRKVESLKNDIKVLEEKKGELTSKAKQSERDRLDNEIKTKNEQLREAEQKLKDAEQGEFHPLKFHAARQASASSRGRSGGRRGRERGGVEMPVQLGEGFGLDKGLPGLAEWAVGFLEDLVLGPLETAAMARMGGGEEGEEEGETALSGYSGGMGGMDVSGLAGGLSSALGGGSLSGYSGGVPSMADFKTVDVGGGNINISGTSGGPSGSSSGATVSSGSAIPAASTPTPAHFNDPWWKGSIGKPDMGTLGGLAPMEGATSGSPGPVTSLDGIAPQDPSSVAEAQRDKKNYKPQAMPPTGGKSTPGAVTNWNLLGDSPYTWGFGGSAVPPPFWSPLAQHNATGGPVGTDTVPAWLTPGEFVVNADATNKYLPMLKNMNGFSSGGMVPQYFDDGAKNPVQAAAVQPMPPKPPPNQAPAQPKAPPPSSGDNPKTVDAKPNPNLKTVDQAPSSDIHNLPGLTTPGAGSQQPGTGQAPSPGIGFGGGIIGMAEGAASSGASMSPAGPAAGAAMQTAFQFINRAASYGAQVAGIGVEALLESILPSSSAAGGDWSKTIPGKLLMGVTGIRPTNQNTAGNTPKIGEGSEGPQTTVGNQFYGDVHVNGVHNPDEFNSWSRQQSQSAVGAYPANTR